MWTEWGIGLICVMLASALLILGVFLELAPAGGVTGRGRWMLALGLGGGLLAFAAKLFLMVVFLVTGSDLVLWLERDVPLASESKYASVETRGEPFAGDVRQHWQALPVQAPAPPDNPMNEAKVALGRALFMDRSLSRNGDVACVSCHDLRTGTDGRRTSRGVNGQMGTRNAPTVWNAAFQARLFWDGRAGSLEEQALGPLVNPIEMGMPTLDKVVARVEAQPAYRRAFALAFEGDYRITSMRIAQALAAFERTLITPDAPYDRFVRGDVGALSAQAMRGMALFESVGCVQCHSGPNFSGASLLTQEPPYRIFPATGRFPDERWGLMTDRGRAEPGGQVAVWRIPSLRNVALTPPYFHNGAVDRLEDAVRIMARSQLGWSVEGAATSEDGTEAKVVWAPEEHTTALVPARVLRSEDVADLVAFLRALSSERLTQVARRSVSAGEMGFSP